MARPLPVLIATAGVFAIASAFTASVRVQAAQDPTTPEFFSTRVKPVFTQNCARCHSGMNHRGGLNLDTRAALLKGGRSGPAIAPGDPARSLLLARIRHEGPEDGFMPPNRGRLSDADIQAVSDWVKAGALMPASP